MKHDGVCWIDAFWYVLLALNYITPEKYDNETAMDVVPNYLFINKKNYLITFLALLSNEKTPHKPVSCVVCVCLNPQIFNLTLLYKSVKQNDIHFNGHSYSVYQSRRKTQILFN